MLIPSAEGPTLAKACCRTGLFHRNLRLQNQDYENPLDDEQDEEGIAEVSPLFVDPRQQKVESKTSVSQLPQDGQST